VQPVVYLYVSAGMPFSLPLLLLSVGLIVEVWSVSGSNESFTRFQHP